MTLTVQTFIMLDHLVNGVAPFSPAVTLPTDACGGSFLFNSRSAVYPPDRATSQSVYQLNLQATYPYPYPTPNLPYPTLPPVMFYGRGGGTPRFYEAELKGVLCGQPVREDYAFERLSQPPTTTTTIRTFFLHRPAPSSFTRGGKGEGGGGDTLSSNIGFAVLFALSFDLLAASRRLRHLPRGERRRMGVRE